MKLIVGLGNPGVKYKQTRHNAGRMLVEKLAVEEKVKFKLQKKLSSLISEISIGQEEIILACPEVFMNLSGEPVSALTAHYGIDPKSDLLVVVDDHALELGRIRLRAKGSDGGHNGLKSIFEFLGHSDYCRLRIGIAPEGGPCDSSILKEFVLDKFAPREAGLLDRAIHQGIAACRLWISHPVERVMSVVNANK